MLNDAYDLSFYEFDDEKDPKEYGVLLCDVIHGKPPMKPTYMGIGWYWYYHGVRYGAETLSLPTTHGWDSRFINGYPYITAVRTTQQEAKEREPVFREQIKPFLKDFDGVWDPLKKDLLETYKEARESRGLKEWNDIKKLNNNELLSFFLDFVYVINRKEGETHFYMLMAICYISGLFHDMWRSLFDTEPGIDPKFHQLMSGFESMDVIFTRKLWHLGRRAVELGLEETFNSTEDKEVLGKLETTEEGEKWAQEYHAFLLEHGWRADRMHAYDYPVWLEDPSIGISRIKVMMSEPVFPFDDKYDRLTKERQEAEKEIMTKVPESQKDSFTLLMKAAQKAGYWSEDHSYYCDLYIGALGRWIISEYGRRFAEAGCIDDPGDIHFLHPDEIRKAAIPMGRINLRHYVEPRKNKYQKNLEIEPAPFYGDEAQIQDVVRSDPTLSVSTQIPIVREDLEADLYGAAGAPGFAEGTARVIYKFEQLKELQSGEILVAPGTSASWTVAFSVIKGLITDGGGALSHPVIMAREFGVPCVSGCVKGTQKIKTGQRIKVDGDKGIVFILDK